MFQGPEYAWVLSTMSGMTSLPHDEIERQFDSLRRSPGGSQTNEREPLDDLQLPHGIREAFDAHSLSVVHADVRFFTIVSFLHPGVSTAMFFFE